MRRRCQALAITPTERAFLWDHYLDPNNNESAKLLAQSMLGFNNAQRQDELETYNERFFEVVLHVFETRSTDFSKEFFHNLFPRTDNLQLLIEVHTAYQHLPLRTSTPPLPKPLTRRSRSSSSCARTSTLPPARPSNTSASSSAPSSHLHNIDTHKPPTPLIHGK